MLINFILSIFGVKRYVYGKIQGYKIPARKDIISGVVEVKYRNKEDHMYSVDSWAAVKDEYKSKFVQC